MTRCAWINDKFINCYSYCELVVLNIMNMTYLSGKHMVWEASKNDSYVDRGISRRRAWEPVLSGRYWWHCPCSYFLAKKEYVAFYVKHPLCLAWVLILHTFPYMWTFHRNDYIDVYNSIFKFFFFYELVFCSSTAPIFYWRICISY